MEEHNSTAGTVPLKGPTRESQAPLDVQPFVGRVILEDTQHE